MLNKIKNASKKWIGSAVKVEWKGTFGTIVVSQCIGLPEKKANIRCIVVVRASQCVQDWTDGLAIG